MAYFNHGLMEMAREAEGISQEELAQRIGCTQATISRWEHGLFSPSVGESALLCQVLRRPAQFFQREDSLFGGGLPVFYHRALVGATKATRQVNARCFLRAIQIEILNKINDGPALEFPQLPADKFAEGPSGVAAALRALWCIGPGPIPNLVSLIESRGGVVVVEDLGCDEVDALCWWRAGIPRLFFINARKPACRMRFSLAHELGHTVMHGIPVDPAEAEIQADDFAAEFLMPSAQARACIPPNANLARLAALKSWWKLSMAAIAVRGKDSGVYSKERLGSLMKELGTRGWRKREPVEIPHEQPSAFGRMLRRPLEMGYSIDELAVLLYTTSDDLRAMLGNHIEPSGSSGESTWLRLVGD